MNAGRATALVVIWMVQALAGCPPAGKPCADSRDCDVDEVCVTGAAGNACQSSPPGNSEDAGPALDDAGPLDDGGSPDDAGPLGEPDGGPDADAGPAVDDAGPPIGRALRGGIDVGAGTLRSGTRTLRGHIHGVGPAPRVSAGTRTLETPGR